jgi:hypothetical protein
VKGKNGMTDRKVYPVTWTVEQELNAPPGRGGLNSEALKRDLLEYIGEWEHDPSIQAEAGIGEGTPLNVVAGIVLDFARYIDQNMK